MKGNYNVQPALMLIVEMQDNYTCIDSACEDNKAASPAETIAMVCVTNS